MRERADRARDLDADLGEEGLDDVDALGAASNLLLLNNGTLEASNRLSAPLFDTPLYTRSMQQLFEQMYARLTQELPPEHLPSSFK